MTSRPQKGISLRGNTSYDVQIIKIGPPVRTRRDPKYKVKKEKQGKNIIACPIP